MKVIDRLEELELTKPKELTRNQIMLMALEVEEEYADRVAEICVESFEQVTEWFHFKSY